MLKEGNNKEEVGMNGSEKFPPMKEKILKASEELFFRYGIKNITMDEIARHLGMSKKTIYQFFRDKDELVHSLIVVKLEEDKIIFTKTYEESANIVEEVFTIMKNLRDIIGNMNPVIFHELHKYYPETWKEYVTFKNNFILENIEKCLKKGQEQGLVRNDINIKILARMRLENLDMGFFGNVFPVDKFSMLDVQLAMTEHFLYGVCTLKGHKLINKYKNIIEE
jgi:AcrR family transcriptional regulator